MTTTNTTFQVGQQAAGTTQIPGGRAIRVTGTIVRVIQDQVNDLVEIRPDAASQAAEGLTTQAIGYRAAQVEVLG